MPQPPEPAPVPPDRSETAPRTEPHTDRPQTERTKWSFGLVAFYMSCAGVALGAAVASAGYLWFDSVGALVFGSVMTLVCAVTCYRSLRSARS